MILEICANGLQSALNAQKGGADRIELCVSLELGGLTPSYGLIKEVKNQLSIPVHVLIRPRAGNFCYNDLEKAIILEDINQCKLMKLDGVVIGALTEENNPDAEFLLICKEKAGNMHLTFHRAFDIMNRTEKNISTIVDLGFKRILTSGGETSALEGMNEIAKLEEMFGNHIEIMAGSGINLRNVKGLVKNTRVKAIHTSARNSIIQNSDSLFEDELLTNIDVVRKLKEILNMVNNI